MEESHSGWVLLGEMNAEKFLCVLVVSPSGPTQHHKDLFAQHPQCDLYFVTHDTPCEEGGNLGHCPKTSWAETRNILWERVPRKYRYYVFADYDIVFESKTTKCIVDQWIEDLTILHPAILVPYYRFDDPALQLLGREPYTHQAFTNNCVKIVHGKLLNWFFPMDTAYGGTWDAAHYWNILEIPFYRHVWTTHRVIMDNPIHKASWNQSSGRHIQGMVKMWKEARDKLSPSMIHPDLKTSDDPLAIKRYWKTHIPHDTKIEIRDQDAHLEDLLHCLLAE